MESDISDSAYVRQILDGNRDAWKQLVEKHMNTVFLLTLQYVRNFHDAQDITQEAFLQAYTKLSQLRSPSKFVHWLRQITLNLCHNWHRRKREKWISLEAPAGRQEHSGAIAYEYALAYPLPDTLITHPDAELGRIEASEVIQKGLKKLSEKLYSAFELYYMAGLNYREIADHLGIPEGTVKRRLHDARRKFMEEVSDMLEENILLKYAVGLECTVEKGKPSQNVRVFGKGMHLPAACTFILTTAKDSQDELYFHILQGDSFIAAECISIGEFLIKGISPRKKGEAEIKLTLKIDPSGKLQCRAKEMPDKPLVVEGKAAAIATECELA